MRSLDCRASRSCAASTAAPHAHPQPRLPSLTLMFKFECRASGSCPASTAESHAHPQPRLPSLTFMRSLDCRASRSCAASTAKPHGWLGFVNTYWDEYCRGFYIYICRGYKGIIISIYYLLTFSMINMPLAAWDCRALGSQGNSMLSNGQCCRTHCLQ